MTRTFGRRAATAPAGPPRHPAAPSPQAPFQDPRVAALAASVRGADPVTTELRDYLQRRRAAIGPWAWMANGLYAAPVACSWLLGVHGLWLVPISAASLGSRVLLKRARLRWAAQIEAEARTPGP